MNRTRVLLGGLLAGLAVTFACSTGSEPTAIAEKPTARVHRLPTHAPFLGGSPELARRVQEAEARSAWMSRVHTEAVREAIAERKTWPKADRNNQRRICAQAQRLGFVYMKRAQIAGGQMARTDGENRATVAAALAATGVCVAEGRALQSRAMSIFGSSSLPNSAPAKLAATSMTDLAYWMSEMETRFANSGLFGSELAGALDGVLTEAYPYLSSSDYDGLVAQAQFTANSLVEWQLEWSTSGGGGGDGGGDGGGEGGGGGGGEEPELRASPPPLSMFRSARQPETVYAALQHWWAFKFDAQVRTVTYADVTGFLGGWVGGTPVSAAAWGVITSIAAYGAT